MNSSWRSLALPGLLFSLLLAAACGDEGSDAKGDTPSNNSAANNSAANNSVNNSAANNSVDDTGLITYHRDLRPLMDHNCMACHTTGGIAPAVYDFTDPANVQALAPLIVSSVESGRMPPWDLDDSCVEVQGSLALTPEEIGVFSKWMSDGKLMGDVADYVPQEPKVVDIGAERLVNDDVVEARIPVAYAPRADRADDYRCFVIDPGFAQTRYMTGFETIADNPSILHHIVAFSVPGDEGNLSRLAELEGEDALPGYECFGDARVSDQSVIGAWAPGGGVTGLPANTAIEFEPGTRIVLQMHYNRSEGGDGADQSAMRFWFMPEGQRPQEYGALVFIGNLPFAVPPGVNGSEAEACNTVYLRDDRSLPLPPEGTEARDARGNPMAIGETGCVVQDFYFNTSPLNLKLWGTFPHMHLVGRSLKVEAFEFDRGGETLLPKDGSNQCLINSTDWDFDWQRTYWYKQPKELPSDVMVRLTCRYNTMGMENPVQLGEGSEDEMCLGLLYLSAPVPL